MTPQQKQQARKITVDLGPHSDDFNAYVARHFGGNRQGKSQAMRIAVKRLLARPPTKAESGEVPQGRPKAKD